MSPADELRAAARRVRDTASRATTGPWADYSGGEGDAWPVLVYGGPIPGDPTGRPETVMQVHESVVEEIVLPDDAAWIALAGPQIAEPLAAWLDHVAETWVFHKGHVRDYALDIARAINGGAQ